MEVTLASASVARCEGWGSHIKGSGHVDIVPFFLLEWVNAKISINTTVTKGGKLTPSSSVPSF